MTSKTFEISLRNTFRSSQEKKVRMSEYTWNHSRKGKLIMEPIEVVKRKRPTSLVEISLGWLPSRR